MKIIRFVTLLLVITGTCLNVNAMGGKEPGIYPCFSRDNPEFEEIATQTRAELDKMIKEKGEDAFIQYAIDYLNWLKNIKKGDIKFKRSKNCYTKSKYYLPSIYDVNTGREITLRDRITFSYIVGYANKKSNLTLARHILEVCEQTDSSLFTNFFNNQRQLLILTYYDILTKNLSDQPIERVDILYNEMIKYIHSDGNRAIGIRELIEEISESVNDDIRKEIFNNIYEKYERCEDCDDIKREKILYLLGGIARSIKDNHYIYIEKLSGLLNKTNLHPKKKEIIIDLASPRIR
ncbi:MAG: hypothetical protein ACPL7I_05680 [Myxococcota bacterium]